MKTETIEEALNREFPLDKSYEKREAMFVGIKWQQERSYSEEELFSFLLEYQSNYGYANNKTGLRFWFNKYKK
jgi:hypothetical protein